MSSSRHTVIVALGGNAINPGNGSADVYIQFANTRRSLKSVADLIEGGSQVVLTHGNGPQIGDKLIRVEASRHLVPPIPLGVLVADSQGSMGYMIAQTMKNQLVQRGMDQEVVTLLTQILVDPDDRSIADPSKFVGPSYQKEEAASLTRDHGWIMKEDVGRGWRRVVPSPMPLEIVEKRTIRSVVDSGAVVVCAGGGGIPVYRETDGTLEGVDAVVDKDLASAVLGRDIGADVLYILTSVDRVYLNFNQENQRALETMTVAEAKRWMGEGHFPPGSMGPKVQAGIDFLSSGGSRVVITSAQTFGEALDGRTGTVMIPDD